MDDLKPHPGTDGKVVRSTVQVQGAPAGEELNSQGHSWEFYVEEGKHIACLKVDSWGLGYGFRKIEVKKEKKAQMK